MKKRTTIITRKYEIWIARSGQQGAGKEDVSSRERELLQGLAPLVPERETDDPSMPDEPQWVRGW